MASGWNLWVWLECIGMGVVVRRYIDILIIIITFPYSTCISSFFGSSIPTSLFILKNVFFILYIYMLQHMCRVYYYDYYYFMGVAKCVPHLGGNFCMEGCKSGLCQCPLSRAERHRVGRFSEVNFILNAC